MIDLTKVLFDKYKNQKLAHFYILKTSTDVKDAKASLEDWSKNLLIKIISNTKNINLTTASNILKIGHSDILWIKKIKGKDKYIDLDDENPFRELFKLQNYNPIELKQYLVIIEDCQDITLKNSNKLLKILEEPFQQTTIFFLNPTSNFLLPTIESRAITLKISPSNSEKVKPQLLGKKRDLKSMIDLILNDEFSQYNLRSGTHQYLISFLTKGENLQDLLETIRKKPLDEKILINFVVYLATLFEGNYKTKHNFLKEIRNYNQSKSINNPYSGRVFSVLQRFKEIYDSDALHI